MNMPPSPPANNIVDGVRRQLLAGAAAIATLSLAPGVVLIAAEAKAPTGPASAKVRWGLLVDSAKCGDGCDGCVDACRTENGWTGHGRPRTDPQWIRLVCVRAPASGATWMLPMMCQHCRFPPCVDVCPTGASFRRADGIVLVDKHICIGCRYCMMACPYNARSFVHEDIAEQRPHAPRGKGTVESCTLCVHRVDAGGIPACVEACGRAGGGALTFGDLNDPDSEIARRAATYAAVRVRADLGLDPAVRYHIPGRAAKR